MLKGLRMTAESKSRTTRSGIPLKNYYGADDRIPAGRNEAPGQFPFMRGRRDQAPRTGSWIQRELSGEGDARRSNQQFHELLAHGQTGLDIIGDGPTGAQLDPDHPLAANAIGTQGVSVCHKQDFLDLLKDIPLDRMSVSASFPPLFFVPGLCIAAREYGFTRTGLRGSTVLKPLYCETNGLGENMGLDARVRTACDVIAFCAAEMPRFHAYVEDTYFFSESGLTPVEEMALGFVEIRYLVREMLSRGVDIDSFAPRIVILVNCGMEFFEEIAKIRATRRLFARMIRDEFGAKDPRSWSVVVTSHTSGLTMTTQQLANNIVRGTTQALSLVLAGAQAMEISTFDEGYRTPTAEAHLVGLRTQQIIDLETGAAKVVDPLGGSYFVEALTAEMERRIWDMVLDIEARGHPRDLDESGWFRQFFDDKMRRHLNQVESGERPLVGVNVHRMAPEGDTLLRDVSERKIRPYRQRAQEVRDFRARRDQAKAAAALRSVLAVAEGTENLVPPVMSALDAGATMGEIAGVIRMAYGEPYDPFGALQPPV